MTVKTSKERDCPGQRINEPEDTASEFLSREISRDLCSLEKTHISTLYEACGWPASCTGRREVLDTDALTVGKEPGLLYIVDAREIEVMKIVFGKEEKDHDIRLIVDTFVKISEERLVGRESRDTKV